MSRALEDLEPETQRLCRELLMRAALQGITLVVVQTLRTHQEQDLIWQKGRSRPGPKVTNAKSGYSWHEWGRAFDVAFKQGDHGVTWKGPWQMIGKLGREIGLTWGGDWESPDKPHFEFKNGQTLAAMRSQDPYFGTASDRLAASAAADTSPAPETAPQTTETSP